MKQRRRIFNGLTVLWLLHCVTIAGILGCNDHREAASNPKPAAPSLPRFSSTQPLTPGPVAAIWWEGGDMKLYQPLIVGVWSDGTIIWSSDRRRGGPPYSKGKIEIGRVEKLADDLNGTGFFDLKRQVNFGPDAAHTVIAAQARGARQWVGSWHDPAIPGVVVTEQGIVIQGTASSASPQYTHFLKVWADARAVVEGVIPATGDRTASVDAAVYKLGR